MRVRPAPRAGPRKPNFCHSSFWGSVHGGISTLARGYSHGVTFFQNLDGLLDNFTLFVSQNCRNYLGCLASSNSGSSPSRAAQSFRTLSACVISGSKIRLRYGSRDVEHQTKVNEDPREILRSAVDYPKKVYLLHSEKGFSLNLCVLSRILQLHSTSRSRGGFLVAVA